MAALCLLALGGCSVVRHSQVRDDWHRVDRERLKRLVVLTHPYPAGERQVGQLWSTLAARHVDLKREFIIKQQLTQPSTEGFDPVSLCARGEEAVDGVLWLRPSVTRKGGGVEAAVEGLLLRCSDGEKVWTASAAGSWSSTDKRLVQTIADYSAELGPQVEPYVVASWHLLRATLDTLPNPVLDDEDQVEKIEHAQ